MDVNLLECAPVDSIQCGLTEKCKNINCIFKLRDCYDFPVFWYSGIQEKQEAIMHKLGIEEIIYPEFTANIGTNCIYVNCKDKKWED